MITDLINFIETIFAISVFIIICRVIYVIAVKLAKDDTKQYNSSPDHIHTIDTSSYHAPSTTSYRPSRNTTSVNHSSNNNYDHLSYYDFEDKFLDKIDRDLEKYSDYCYEVQEFFEEHFSIEQRIKKLETAINKLDKIHEKYASYGNNGIKLFEENTSDYYKGYSPNNIIKNTNGDNYDFEFDNIDFTNYDFITYLLNLYKTDTEHQKQHLKQEKLYHDICYEFGGTKEYEEYLETQKQIKAVRKKVLSILKKEKSIFQSKITGQFDDNFEKNEARKYIEELHKKNKVSKEKNGRSYLITYIEDN